MARTNATIMMAALLLVLLPVVCAKEWDHTESWEESDSPATAHGDEDSTDADVEPVDDGEEDEEEEDIEAPSTEYVDTDFEDEAERDVDEQNDDNDEEQQDEDDAGDEESPPYVIGEEAEQGKVQMASIEEKGDNNNYNENNGSDNNNKASPASCAVYAMGSKVEDKAVCTEGNVGSCLTSKIELKMDNIMKTMYTSNCDKMQLCEGMGKGYYKIEDGKCGTMPGEGGQKIYCSRTSPEDGKIPNGVDCPQINMRVTDEDTNKPSNDDGSGHRGSSSKHSRSSERHVVKEDQSTGHADKTRTPTATLKARRSSAGTLAANSLLMGISALAVVFMAQ